MRRPDPVAPSKAVFSPEPSFAAVAGATSSPADPDVEADDADSLDAQPVKKSAEARVVMIYNNFIVFDELLRYDHNFSGECNTL
jgi:hypothetical protein